VIVKQEILLRSSWERIVCFSGIDRFWCHQVRVGRCCCFPTRKVLLLPTP
jgi:hypothetical protein